MPAYVMNLGLELPIFDDLELPQALTKAEIRNASNLETDRFIRRIRCVPFTGALSLKETLRRTSETLEDAAEMCGATVIDHSWGLLSLDAMNTYYRGACIDSYGIVANVEVIRQLTHPTDIQESEIDNGLYRYSKETGHSFRWLDRGIHQFSRGESAISGSGLFLIDIDPVCEVDGIWPAIIHTND